MWNALWNVVLYLSVCGMRSGILCYIFLHVERALVFCVLCFCVWNALWYFVFYFSACGIHSGIFGIYFCMWNALWYFLLFCFTFGTRSGIVKSRVIFTRVVRTLIFCVINFWLFSQFLVELYLPWFPLIICLTPFWKYIYFTRYGILEFCVILLHVERALVCGI